MRFNQVLFDKVKGRNFLGEDAAYGRVTVDPYWSLEKTPPIYGNSFRGPYRYYTDGSPVEYEVPSIKSITWDRSNGQDIASCTITIYNTWHNANTELPELAGQLGQKGRFWPKRGQGDSSATWNQSPANGAYTKEGIWDNAFSWENVLVEDVIIRTYEGMGIAPVSGAFKSIEEHITDNEAWITGVWIVNSVTAGSDGLMTLSCSDIGRILIDQIVFPPVIPGATYPLEYYPPGKTAFDSPWGPKVKNGTRINEFGQEVTTSPASKGEVWIREFNSTADSDTTVNTDYPASHAVDGNWDTYALTEAYATPDGGKPYFEFLPGGSASVGAGIDSMELKTWAGGYTVYISIAEDPNPASPSSSSVWKGSEDIPGGGIKYVKKVEIPLYLPDGMEPSIDVEFSDVVWVDEDGDEIADPFEDRTYPNTYYAHKVRLTFENLYYSHVPDGTDRYRAGIRDFILYRNGAKVSSFSPDFEALPWTFCMEQHPTRGYWVADNSGSVYGFGDAADYDTTGFGMISLAGDSTNRVVGIAAHPSGEGYWVLDWMGNVYAQGVATYYGEYTVPNPYVGVSSTTAKVSARGIAPTYTGNGYWVVYSNGVIRGFGDATPTYTTVPTNDVAIFMDAFLPLNYDPGKYVPYNIGLKATAIASHPKKMGFWVTDGSGQVWAYGDAENFGGLVERVYNKGKAGTFRLQNLEWATSIESTVSGDGYWVAFGSGKVASFGDATKLGKDPYVSESVRGLYEENILVDETAVMDYSFFRDILWSIARDPDGSGFWVLKASGEVIPYDAEFWGKPGYDGSIPTGYRWHDGNFDGDWCVDEATEIFTKRGWLKYSALMVGDTAYSINPLTGQGEWKKVSDVNVFRAKTRRMLSIAHQQHSSITTMNHNWLIQDWKDNFKFKKSHELAVGQKILRAAELSQSVKVFDDDFVELMAWFVAEGWNDSGRVRISQSYEKNIDYYNRINSLLIRVYGEPGNMKDGVTRHPKMFEAVQAVKAGMPYSQASKEFDISIGGIKVWASKDLKEIPIASNWALENLSDNGIATFSIRKDHSQEILKFTEDGKGKIPSWDFVSLLTVEQAKLFIEVFVMADGNNTKNIHAGINQKRPETVDRLQAIASLAGYATSSSVRFKGEDSFSPLSEYTRLAIHKSKRSTIKKDHLKEVTYDGIVWCPDIEDNHTWCARRDGHVFFTGNCNIVKEILMWGGFLFYDPAITSDEAPSVYGAIESTGIITDTTVGPDKFDKKTLMDVIKELTEVVGYRFYIDEEGRAVYTSPNWWRAGNFDQDGIRIYVDEVTGDRVSEGDVGAIPFIPIVHESEDMLSYSASLSSANKRSEIIIGTDLPDPKDATRTGYIRHTPPHALETVAGGVNTMRGIERTALWVSQLFENEEERKLMAELIGLHSWFSARTGSASIVGNPLLSVGDQVRLVERNTSETFIHLINSINSSLDNDTGIYTMTIETNWLGTADDWVIATESKESQYVYTVISERLNSWQAKTGRQLAGTGSGNTDYAIANIIGGFTTTLSEVAAINEMIVLGDSLSYLDSTLDGLTGDRWPNLLEDYGSVVTVKNGAFSGFTSRDLVDTPIVAPESTDVLVIFVGANDQNVSLSTVDVVEYTANLETLLADYPATTQLIVFPWPWTGYPSGEPDPAPTEEEYNAFATAAENVATAAGARFLHMGEVISEIVAAAGETTWDDYIVDEIHASALGHELIAESVSNKINVVYGASSNWEFNGSLQVIDSVDDAYLVIDILSNLGANIYMEVYSGSTLIKAFNLDYVGQRLSLGSLGVSGSVSDYTYVIEGVPTSRGTGRLKLNLEVDGVIVGSIEDSILFLEA